MFQEIKSVEEVHNEAIKDYIENNPMETLVDLEDESAEKFSIRRFVVNNNSGHTVLYLECDSRHLNQPNLQVQMQVNLLNQRIVRDAEYFPLYARSINSY